MRLKYGRQKGRTTETLLLRLPDYAVWMLDVSPGSPVSREFRRLIAAFAARPFLAPCQLCGRPATRAVAYPESTRLLLFCGQCTLYPAENPIGFAQDVRTFSDAIAHVENQCSRRLRRGTRTIVRNLARAKGLPARVTESAAEVFFAAHEQAPSPAA